MPWYVIVLVVTGLVAVAASQIAHPSSGLLNWKSGNGLAVVQVNTPSGPAALDDGAMWLVVASGDNDTHGTLWGILTKDGQKRAVETAKLPATEVTFAARDVKQVFS